MTSSEEFKSDRLLEEIRRRESAKEVVDVEEARVKVVLFACGGKKFAFHGREIREILPPCEIAWVPELPPYLPGLINVRGDVESVVDIGHFLAQRVAEADRCLVAMAVRDGFRSGILIDAIEDVTDVPASAVQAPLSTLEGAVRDLVTGEVEIQGELVPLIGIDRLAARIAP